MLITTSYAIGDTKTPARYAVYRVVANTLVSLASCNASTCSASSWRVFAAWMETIALGLKLRANIGSLGLDQVRLGRTLVLGVLSVGPAALLRTVLPESFMSSVAASLLILVVFGGSFAIAAPALGLFDVRSLLRRLQRRR